jgi:hypothetical protein
MSTTQDTHQPEIERDEMPLGSFRYGQLASFDGVDAPADAWLICTHCSKPKNEDDNGASGFDRVLVVHFIHRDESEARLTVDALSVPAVLVRPARQFAS